MIPHHPPPSLHFEHPHHPHPVHPHPHPHHELPRPPPTVVAFSTPRPAGSPPHGAGVAAHPIPHFGPPHGGLVSGIVTIARGFSTIFFFSPTRSGQDMIYSRSRRGGDWRALDFLSNFPITTPDPFLAVIFFPVVFLLWNQRVGDAKHLALSLHLSHFPQAIKEAG